MTSWIIDTVLDFFWPTEDVGLDEASDVLLERIEDNGLDFVQEVLDPYSRLPHREFTLVFEREHDGVTYRYWYQQTIFAVVWDTEDALSAVRFALLNRAYEDARYGRFGRSASEHFKVDGQLRTPYYDQE